jgi:histidinol-phosphate phosphatase family protein
MKQAVILAGGKGTRLSQRLAGLPKPLIDICGKPLLERQIELLKRYSFTHVLLLVNHGAQHIIDFCASRNNWGMHIDCVDDGEPLGTAGATLAILPRLEENFLVMYGDTMLEVDLTRFENFHNSRPEIDATLFLHPNDHPHDSDLVDVDDEGRVSSFDPYPHDEGRYYPNLVNAALYYVRRSALEPWCNTHGALDFGKDIFPAMLERGAVLLGYNSPEYIKDCGTPARLDKVCTDLTSGRVARSSLNVKQSAVFMDRDGTINREVNHLSHHEQLELLPGAEQAIKRLNHSIYRTVVVTNQPVLARGDCSPQELRQIHNKMDTLLGREGAYVDRIYYCPHHPDKGFPDEVSELKINCNCRKPEVGMIELAKQELNIDVAQSWLIGDTTVDLLTAHRAGLRSILVQTGFAGLDCRHRITPNFVVPDLPAAVNFILEDYPRLLNVCDELGKETKLGGFVLIGGLSRCGKSNLASCLKDSLRLQGYKSAVISADRWLRNSDERLPGVLGRYAIDELTALLRSLVSRTKPLELKLPSYDKITRQRIVNAETLWIDTADVVIVEGTIALALLESIPQDIVQTWFVEIDEHERKRRVLQEYQLRGMSLYEAESVYLARQDDETPAVNATKVHATYCIHLELGGAPTISKANWGINDN